MRSPQPRCSCEPDRLEVAGGLALRAGAIERREMRRVEPRTARRPEECAKPRPGECLGCARERALRAENERLRSQNEALERAVRRLRALSVTDSLTGLPNQRSFRQCLGRELKRALRGNGALALVIFDIDDFKALNDEHGHAVGDAVLARVAGVMQAQVREVDLLARYGGEEFALIAPGTSLAGARSLAEKIRFAVGSSEFSVLALEGPEKLRATVSAGVARFRGDERALFNDADRALYRAKAAGKDCVVAADD